MQNREFLGVAQNIEASVPRCYFVHDHPAERGEGQPRCGGGHDLDSNLPHVIRISFIY